MNLRILEINNINEIKKEMQKIGVSSYGIKIMSLKSISKIIKLENIDYRIANILKQEMLSIGGDVACDKRVISGEIKKTDVILIGNLSQYLSLIKKIKIQPFGLSKLSDILKNELTKNQRIKKIKCRNHTLTFGKRTLIMGILNVTPDSFSDGGLYYNVDKAVEQGINLAHYSDIIDIGGESSRPGSLPISSKEELKRIIPVISKLVKKIKIPISVDTYKPEVAKEVLKLGVSIINDITGLKNDKLAEIVAEYNVPVIIMHMKGAPFNMQENPVYDDVIGEILSFFINRIKKANEIGIDKIIIDPGIGFGKTLEHNLTIIKHLKEFKILNRPILIGTSRKSLIGKILNLPVNQRLQGTLATVVVSVLNGANIVRVHDAAEMKQVVEIISAIMETK